MALFFRLTAAIYARNILEIGKSSTLTIFHFWSAVFAAWVLVTPGRLFYALRPDWTRGFSYVCTLIKYGVGQTGPIGG